MRRRGLRLAWSWFLRAAAVGTVAWSVRGDRLSLGLALAVVGAIILILAYEMYSEAMTQSRADGLATTRADQAWLLSLCFGGSAMIIGLPVNLLMLWNLHDVRVAALEAVSSFEHGADAPDLLSLHRVSTNAIFGAFTAVSLATLWRQYIRPHDLWRAAAPSAVLKGLKNFDES